MIYLLFIQLLLIIYLIGTILFNRKSIYSSVFLLSLQVIIIICVIFNRLAGQGLTLSIFLYLTFIPVLIEIISKVLAKRKKETWLKKLANQFNSQLDEAFFTFTEKNKGLHYFSRRIFRWIFLFFLKRVTNPHKLIVQFLIIPWLVLMVCVTLEIYKNSLYLAGVLLGLNLLNFRFLLLILRIVEFVSLENLNFLNNYYLWSMEKKNPVFFQKLENFAQPLKDNPNLENTDALLAHWFLFFCGINSSGVYFLSLILKKKLIEIRLILNTITLLVTLGGCIIMLDWFWMSNFLSFLIFGLIYLIVLLSEGFEKIEADIISNHESLLKFLDFTREKFISFNVFTKEQLLVDIFHVYPWESFRPNNIFEFWEPILIFGKSELKSENRSFILVPASFLILSMFFVIFADVTSLQSFLWNFSFFGEFEFFLYIFLITSDLPEPFMQQVIKLFLE